jgi:Fic-DOC domain mobile mystery protein B
MDLSDTMDGATPIDDISGLRMKSIRTQAQLNEAEFFNILKAAEKYLAGRPSKRLAPFTLQWVKKLHRDMFGDVWTWAGTIRNVELNHGWCARAYQIEEQLQNMLADLAVWQTAEPPIEQAARLHHRAVVIHPFLNGNGRWARMLANIWLRQRDAGLVKWPEQTLAAVSVIRDQYLRVIRHADNGDYAEWIELHKAYWMQKMA